MSTSRPTVVLAVIVSEHFYPVPDPALYILPCILRNCWGCAPNKIISPPVHPTMMDVYRTSIMSIYIQGA
jgi:hypothetical protein